MTKKAIDFMPLFGKMVVPNLPPGTQRYDPFKVIIK